MIITDGPYPKCDMVKKWNYTKVGHHRKLDHAIASEAIHTYIPHGNAPFTVLII
jgi:hypothetical protein